MMLPQSKPDPEPEPGRLVGREKEGMLKAGRLNCGCGIALLMPARVIRVVVVCFILSVNEGRLMIDVIWFGIV
jgi:hypothetical protein